MRIDAYSQVQHLYGTQQMKSMSKQAVKTRSTDAVQISDAGKDFQIAKQAVAKAADVRTERVDALKAEIAKGTYDVSADDFADKLLEKFDAFQALIS